MHFVLIHSDKLLFVHWTNKKIMDVDIFFTPLGIKQIVMKMDTYQHMIKYPNKYGWKDLREHHSIPKLPHFYH